MRGAAAVSVIAGTAEARQQVDEEGSKHKQKQSRRGNVKDPESVRAVWVQMSDFEWRLWDIELIESKREEEETKTKQLGLGRAWACVFDANAYCKHKQSADKSHRFVYIQ